MINTTVRKPWKDKQEHNRIRTKQKKQMQATFFCLVPTPESPFGRCFVDTGFLNKLPNTMMTFCENSDLVKDVAYVDYNPFNKEGEFLQLHPIGDYFFDTFVVTWSSNFSPKESRKLLQIAVRSNDLKIGVISRNEVMITASQNSLAQTLCFLTEKRLGPQFELKNKYYPRLF